MKKFLLLAALLGGTVLAGKAEFHFVYQDKPIENGSTVLFGDYEVWDDIPGMVEVIIDPNISVIADEGTSLTIKAESLTGNSFQMCAGGACVQGVSITKDDVSLKPEVSLPLLLDVSMMFFDGEEVIVPYYEIKVEAWDNDMPDDYVTFTLKMGNLDAGVDELVVGGSKVTINGTTLSYDLAGASQLSIYSLSGKTVMSRNVSGNGTLSLGNLPKGVYVYRVSGKTGKFIIR